MASSSKVLISWSQRKTGNTTNFISYGKAMRALGYHPLVRLGKNPILTLL